MTAWHTVHVRVNDAATGHPTPVRILLESQGRHFAPLGRLSEFSTEAGADTGGQVIIAGRPWYYIDRTCEVRLPPGELNVEVWKGPECIPLRTTVRLAPGQISLRLTIERQAYLQARGWYSGDTHVSYLSPHAALLEGAAENLAVVNLLACERPSASGQTVLPNILAFSGQSPALERPGHLVVVNTRNTHPALGTLGLLNCHRAVYPLSIGQGDGSEDWTLADWCDQCHRKKTGLVIWADPGAISDQRSAISEGDRLCSEALADLILGRVDAFEVTRFESAEPRGVLAWYELLKAGLRVPLVGGSGKDSAATVLGSVRTFAHLIEGEALTYGAWIEAVRAGRTFVTNGPLLELTVGEGEPGSVLRVKCGEHLPISARALGPAGVGRVEILVNGKVVEAEGAAETEWRAEESAWVAARCLGGTSPDGQVTFAQTSPVHVEVEGRPFQPDAAVVDSLIGRLERLAGWARTATGCGDRQRTQLLDMVISASGHLRCGKGGGG
jgi:hypothetical protein